MVSRLSRLSRLSLTLSAVNPSELTEISRVYESYEPMPSILGSPHPQATPIGAAVSGVLSLADPLVSMAVERITMSDNVQWVL